ncbi:hypothetical protein T07_12583, partial [Trichinella nelsoni]
LLLQRHVEVCAPEVLAAVDQIVADQSLRSVPIQLYHADQSEAIPQVGKVGHKFGGTAENILLSCLPRHRDHLRRLVVVRADRPHCRGNSRRSLGLAILDQTDRRGDRLHRRPGVHVRPVQNVRATVPPLESLQQGDLRGQLSGFSKARLVPLCRFGMNGVSIRFFFFFFRLYMCLLVGVGQSVGKQESTTTNEEEEDDDDGWMLLFRSPSLAHCRTKNVIKKNPKQLCQKIPLLLFSRCIVVCLFVVVRMLARRLENEPVLLSSERPLVLFPCLLPIYIYIEEEESFEKVKKKMTTRTYSSSPDPADEKRYHRKRRRKQQQQQCIKQFFQCFFLSFFYITLLQRHACQNCASQAQTAWKYF